MEGWRDGGREGLRFRFDRGKPLPTGVGGWGSPLPPLSSRGGAGTSPLHRAPRGWLASTLGFRVWGSGFRVQGSVFEV